MESCRNCVNLDDRRYIDNIASCAMHHGPSVSCAEFKPKNLNPNFEESQEGFCVNCVNFEEVGGIPLCARDHRPGVACNAFKVKNRN